MSAASSAAPIGRVARVWTITLNPAIDHTLRVPELRPGEVHRVEAEQLEAGGKGVGVASVLAAQQVPVSASGFLGADNAPLFEQAFAQRGIADAMLRVPGRTRTNIKITDAANGHTTDINLAGIVLDAAAWADAETRLLRQLGEQVQSGDWCVLAGSLPPGLGVATLERFARTLAACGAQLLIDTGGALLGTLLERLRDSAALPTLIKPNRVELEELVGRALPVIDDIAAAASQLQRAGVRDVIVSLGGEGAVIASAAGCWHALPPRVPVVTTVGAGDALVAGAIAALREGVGMPGAAIHGMACAAARIQRVAAELPPREEIDRIAAAIVPQPLSVR